MFPTPIQRAPKGLQYLYKIALPITLLLWLLPLAAVMLTSVRSLADITAGNYWGVPTEFALVENYSTVFTSTQMFTYILNSITITIPAVFFAILISSMAGFTLAIHRFKLRFVIFAMFIAGNFIPFQILMIPVVNIMIRVRIFGDTLYNTRWALILFHIAFQSGFCTFFLRNFIAELPIALIESARVEGAGEWHIYLKIILPLIRPALGALAVLIFTFIWNDFFWSLVLVQSDSVRPVTVGLQALRGQWVASWHLISAGSVVAALPPVVVFFIMQKQFIQGLTFGAVKG